MGRSLRTAAMRLPGHSCMVSMIVRTEDSLYADAATDSSTSELLYVAQDLTQTSDFVPITWDVASITGENWIANGTLGNGTAAGSLTINPDKYLKVLPLTASLLKDNNTAVSGFAMFATQLSTLR